MTERNDTEIARDLLDMVNNMSYSSNEFVDEVLMSHRTLQQNTFRLVVDLLKAWEAVGDVGRFDARNEHTVKSAKVMLGALRDANYGVDYTPSI